MQHPMRRLPPWLFLVAGLLMVAALGFIDYLTGDYSLLIFYAIPIAIEGWFLGHRGAVITASAAGCARVSSDFLSYPGTSIRYWNSFQDVLFLLMTGCLVATVRQLLRQEERRDDREGWKS